MGLFGRVLGDIDLLCDIDLVGFPKAARGKPGSFEFAAEELKDDKGRSVSSSMFFFALSVQGWQGYPAGQLASNMCRAS